VFEPDGLLGCDREVSRR